MEERPQAPPEFGVHLSGASCSCSPARAIVRSRFTVRIEIRSRSSARRRPCCSSWRSRVTSSPLSSTGPRQNTKREYPTYTTEIARNCYFRAVRHGHAPQQVPEDPGYRLAPGIQVPGRLLPIDKTPEASIDLAQDCQPSIIRRAWNRKQSGAG